jgi:hypothetical protein
MFGRYVGLLRPIADERVLHDRLRSHFAIKAAAKSRKNLLALKLTL